MLRTFGSYELPFGARGFILRDASGVVKKAVEGWQLSWVLGMESGPPLSVTATGAGSTMQNGRNWPILVRSDLWNDKQGKARMAWGPQGEFIAGTYLERDYVKVLDTNLCNRNRVSETLYLGQCKNDTDINRIVINDSAPYALALAERDAKGMLIPVKYDRDYMGDDGVNYKAGDNVIVFRNADQSDGRNASGNYKGGRMTSQGRFNFDMAASKSVEFMEGKRFEIRVDVQNILNHATPIGSDSPAAMESGGKYVSIDAPTLTVTSSGAIGLMSNKGGHRTFQARLALRF